MSSKKLHVYPILLVLSGCGVISLAAGSARPSLALASILNLATRTPEQAYSWAQAFIPKPTATPRVVPESAVASALGIEPALDIEHAVTPASLVVEIVPDTPTAESKSLASTASENLSDQEYYQPAPADNDGYKAILVDISQQHLYAYSGDQLVYSFVASTGMNNATAVGNFSVLSKIPNAYGATWNIWMPNWLGIYWAGGLQNGIHALPILPNGAQLWAGYLGTPISYGCVVLGADESQLLFDWADMGTPVNIQW